MMLPLAALAQDAPKVEVFGGYSYLHSKGDSSSDGINLNGWNASVAGNLTPSFGLVADISGHYTTETVVTGLTTTGSGVITSRAKLSDHLFLFGPRFSYRKHERVTPFAHVLVGGFRAKGSLSGAFFLNETDTGFAAAAGGGVDVKLSQRFAFRLVQADYVFDRSNGESGHNARISTGLVFRFGK